MKKTRRKRKAEIKLLNLIEDVEMLMRKCVDPAQNALLQGLQQDASTWLKNNLDGSVHT